MQLTFINQTDTVTPFVSGLVSSVFRQCRLWLILCMSVSAPFQAACQCEFSPGDAFSDSTEGSNLIVHLSEPCARGYIRRVRWVCVGERCVSAFGTGMCSRTDPGAALTHREHTTASTCHASLCVWARWLTCPLYTSFHPTLLLSGGERKKVQISRIGKKKGASLVPTWCDDVVSHYKWYAMKSTE